MMYNANTVERTLYLTKDPVLIKRQLNGEVLGPIDKDQLLDRVSTDTYPTRACFRYDDEYLATKALTGLKLNGEYVDDNAVRNNHFNILVAGRSFGCGSSREHFPLSLKAAGIKLIEVESMERICAQNSQNIGLRYIENQPVSPLDQISLDIINAGGLFRYFSQHPGLDSLPKPQTPPRPMTVVEKIIAAHMGVNYTSPGDLGFLQADKRYSYEIFTPMSYYTLKKWVPNFTITDPKSIFLHYDHSVLDINPDALNLAQETRQIAQELGIKMYDGDRTLGSEGICHTIMLDRHVLPGEVILGTDSHTCQLGAAGALAIGIGATEWAGALLTNRARISVPESIAFRLSGDLPAGVMAKDVMLYLLSQPQIRSGQAIGKVFEFSGEVLDSMPLDEQVVFSNMAVEGGAFTGINVPNQNLIRFLKQRRGLTSRQIKQRLVFPDLGAKYAHQFDIDVSPLEPFIALPGDPRNGVPLSQISGDVKVDIAYIGSCTGGKLEDIKQVALVLSGKKVSPNVRFYVQTSSREVYQQALQMGLVEVIQKAGATILPSGCGACVNFGPGSSVAGEVTISDTNRNFPGRMGKGETYLANPAVVAASAIAGKIISPSSI